MGFKFETAVALREIVCRLKRIEREDMANKEALTDLATRLNAAVEGINTGITGVREDITSLKEKIQDLQDAVDNEEDLTEAMAAVTAQVEKVEQGATALGALDAETDDDPPPQATKKAKGKKK